MVFDKFGEVAGIINPIAGGDPFIIALSTLSGYGILSFFLIYLFCLAGTLLWDNFIFKFSESKVVSYLIRKTHTSDKIKSANNLIKKYFGKNNFLLLLLAKMLYGTRIITISLLGRSKLVWKKFFLYDFIINVPYILFLVSVGWLIGTGLIKSGAKIDSIRFWITIIFLLIITFIIIKSLLHKIIMKLHKEKVYK